VDTSNEIAGDAPVAHRCIGRARRMMVPERGNQHGIMIEAVQNHTPNVSGARLRQRSTYYLLHATARLVEVHATLYASLICLLACLASLVAHLWQHSACVHPPVCLAAAPTSNVSLCAAESPRQPQPQPGPTHTSPHCRCGSCNQRLWCCLGAGCDCGRDRVLQGGRRRQEHRAAGRGHGAPPWP
jgi:hypothetical protein